MRQERPETLLLQLSTEGDSSETDLAYGHEATAGSSDECPWPSSLKEISLKAKNQNPVPSQIILGLGGKLSGSLRHFFSATWLAVWLAIDHVIRSQSRPSPQGTDPARSTWSPCPHLTSQTPAPTCPVPWPRPRRVRENEEPRQLVVQPHTGSRRAVGRISGGHPGSGDSSRVSIRTASPAHRVLGGV